MKRATLLLVAMLCITLSLSAQFKVGLVTDVGGIDDKSCNQKTWQGIINFSKDYFNSNTQNFNFRYLQSSNENDYFKNLENFSAQGVDLIIAPSYLLENAVFNIAKKYINCNYAILDSMEIITLPNVASVVYNVKEGSFLAGVAAGLKARADGKKIVGFIGGMKIPIIEEYETGFRQGVKAVYPDCQILVDYAGDFASPAKGQMLASRQYDFGSYIIYHMAGGTGNGIIREAIQRQKRGEIKWVIGVEKDQFYDGAFSINENGIEVIKSVVLTSMVKRFDLVAYELCKLAMNREFPGGQKIEFSIKNNGVGLPEVNPNLSDEIIAKVNEFKDSIASGKILLNNNIQDSSNFNLQYFVDSFGDATNEPYLLGQATGLFSNYATTNSNLRVSIILSRYEFGIGLFEYGNFRVKDNKKYTISIKIPSGNIYQLYSAQLYPELGRIRLSSLPWGLDPKLIFDGNSLIKFLISAEGTPYISYTFSVILPTLDRLYNDLGENITWLYAGFK